MVPDTHRRLTIRAPALNVSNRISVALGPAMGAYFEGRLGTQKQGDMKEKAKLLRLWWSQNKRCKLCDQLITKEAGAISTIESQV